MSHQHDREEFIAIMTTEGMKLADIRLLMRYGATLQRIAELACSSETADRDRVPCPGEQVPDACLCEHWSKCGCPETAAGALVGSGHHPVTRIRRQEAWTEACVTRLCELYGIKPIFNGDPRGAVLKLAVSSGRTNDWGQEGICVP